MVKEVRKHRRIYKTTIGNSIIQCLQQLDNTLCLLSLGKKSQNWLMIASMVDHFIYLS